MNNPFYITTPIYYGNARPHLGTLYSTVLADVLARHARLQGRPTRFLTGTDEHGLKISQAAAQAGIPVQQFVDAATLPFKELFNLYSINYTDFMRTTSPFHIKAVQAWIKRLSDQGDIYKGVYEGWYCTPCETFVTSKDMDAPGQQNCPNCYRPLELVSEPCYFFRLSAYQDRLLEWYAQHPEWVLPRERVAEVISFVSAGLKDLAISRSRAAVQWGIPYPGDESQLVYVWADALNNYITAVGYGQPSGDQELATWWPAQFQIMGKDIVRFHAVYWPAFLMASGLSLPEHLLVHGWIKVGDQKMSKSKGNAIDPVELAQTYGVDQVRYYLTRYLAITHDAPFSSDDLAQRINTDVANDLGNLLNRVMVMAHKYGAASSTVILPVPHVVSEKIQEILPLFLAELELGRFHIAYQLVGDLVRYLNARIHEVQPWVLAKTDIERARYELTLLLYGLEVVSVLLTPVMPTLMATLRGALGVVPIQEGINYYDDIFVSRERTYKLTQPVVLCPRIELKIESSVVNMFEKNPDTHNAHGELVEPCSRSAEEKTTMSSPEPVIPDISFEHFAQVKLAVGTITAVQEIPKSDKLYELTVDFGPLGTRTILSGIRKYFEPVQLIGIQAVFVLNLAPRALMGKISHGMLLAALTASGDLSLVKPVSPGVAPGTLLT